MKLFTYIYIFTDVRNVRNVRDVHRCLFCYVVETFHLHGPEPLVITSFSWSQCCSFWTLLSQLRSIFVFHAAYVFWTVQMKSFNFVWPLPLQLMQCHLDKLTFRKPLRLLTMIML